MLLLTSTAACRQGSAQGGDILPGRSRPLLEHNWALPRDLKFGPNQFRPPDARSAIVVTPDGVRAYVIPSADDGLVQIVAAIPLGRALEQPNEIGAADFVSQLLQQDINQRLGRTFLGRVQVDQDVDLTRVTLVTLPEDWRQGLTALIGAVRQPHVDAAAVAAYRAGPGFARQTRGLGGAGYRPAVEMARLIGKYPLTPPDPGTTVTRDAALAVASRAFNPASIVLGIGGKVTRQEAEQALRESTAGWTGSASTVQPRSFDASAAGPPVFRAFDEPGYTTWIAIGHAVPPIAASHEAAVAVMTEILNIRLNIATREMRGLANQTVLQVPATTRVGGLLHVRTAGRPESVAPLVTYTRAELARIREAAGVPTNDELEQAKGGLTLSQWQRSLDGARAASSTYAIETARYGSLDRLMGWPDAVRAVTAEQVRSVAEIYVQPALSTTIIGQVEAVKVAQHPRWPATLDELLRTPVPTRRCSGTVKRDSHA